PELSSARCGKRSERLAVALQIPARCGAEAVIAGLALSSLQEAVPKIEPARRIVGGQYQTAAITGSGRCSLAEQLMRLRKAEQRVGGIGRDFKRAGKNRFRIAVGSATQQHFAELNRELRHHRCNLKTAAQRLDRFVVVFKRY